MFTSVLSLWEIENIFFDWEKVEILSKNWVNQTPVKLGANNIGALLTKSISFHIFIFKP